MNLKFWMSLIPACLIILWLSGCSRATYPKERLAESVEQLCRDEYKVDVTAKMEGRTLGIYLVLDTLLDSSSGELAFQEKASDILEDVMTSIRRVTLSTDADVKFFTLIGADQAMGIELVMTRYVDDVKRVLLMDISRDDFFERMSYQLRPSPTVLGKKRVYEFFNDLGRKKIEDIIRNNFSAGITVKDISAPFFLNLLELGMKENVRYQILEIKEKPLSPDHVLYYVKTRETFSAKKGFSEDSFFYPARFVNEYLIYVSAKNFPATVEKIYPLVTLNKEKQRVSVPFPEEFEQYADLSTWLSPDFYLEDAQLPDFIAFQVAQKIRSLLGAEGKKKLQEPYEVEKVEANFVKGQERLNEALPSRSIFELTFTMKKKVAAPEEAPKFSKPLLKIALQTIEEICHNYDFTSFNGIRLLDSERTEVLNIDKSMMRSILGK